MTARWFLTWLLLLLLGAGSAAYGFVHGKLPWVIFGAALLFVLHAHSIGQKSSTP